MWQRTARQQAQSILGTIEKTSGYLVITRSMGDDRMNGKCKQLSIRIYRWSGIAKVMGTKSRENIREYLRNLLFSRRSSEVRGSSGGCDHEILILELANSFNPNSREIRVPEYRSRSKRSYYHPMATWAHGPHSHVSKSFSTTRLDFGQGVGKGDSYRQSALIPTCDAPDSIVH